MAMSPQNCNQEVFVAATEIFPPIFVRCEALANQWSFRAGSFWLLDGCGPGI